MKSSIRSSLLIAALIVSTSLPAAAQDDLGIGDTSIGDKSDLGAPDPLNASEETGTSARSVDVKSMPDFQEVPAETAEAKPPAAEAAQAPETPPTQVAAPAPSRVADDPDFRREGNFNKIYKKYNVDPTPSDQWEQAANNRKSESYKVQKGDTLWDLSGTLFGQSDYWPKIWALNKDEVTNPHQIETWMQIRFYPGDLQEAPTLSVADSAPEKTADGVNPAEATSSLIPPARRRASVVKKLPESLPIYRSMNIRGSASTDFQGLKPPPNLARPNAPLSYYISDVSLNAVGEIMETEMGGPSAGEYQYVFVKLENPGARTLSVIKEVGTVRDGDLYGKVIEVQGEIEIIDPAGEDGLARAMVKKNLAPVEVGAQLVQGHIETVNAVDAPPISGPSVQIVGAQFDSNRTMVDADGLIFLNGGQSEGLQLNQVYPVYANRKLRNPNTTVTRSNDLLGHVRIVKIAGHFSTAIITKLSAEMLVGDMVGGTSSSMAAGTIPAERNDDEFTMEDEAPASSDSGVTAAPDAPSGDDSDELDF